MNRPRGRRAFAGGNLHALNAANDESTLDTLLHEYFQLGMPTAGGGNKRLKRPQSSLRKGDVAAGNAEMTTPESALKAVKKFLKASKDETHIQCVVDTVAAQLHKAKKHRTLLPLVVTLCTELFARSSVFRALIATQAAAFFTKLLEGAGEKDVKSKRRSAAGSTAAAAPSEEVTMVLAMIESWAESFGARYPTVVAGHARLVEMGYDFPRVRERTANAEMQAAAQQQHEASVRELRLKKMAWEMDVNVPEMETTIVEMDSIFEILVPTLEAFAFEEDASVGTDAEATGAADKRRAEDAREEEEEEEEEEDVEWDQDEGHGEEAANRGESSNGREDGGSRGGDPDGDDVEWEGVEIASEDAYEGQAQEEEEDDDDPQDHMDINDIVQAYGLGSSSYQLTISIPTTLCEKSGENEVLFRNLADGVLQIRKRFLPLVDDWLQLADSDARPLEGRRCDVELLRRLHGLRRRLESVTLKWEDLVKEKERKQLARIQPRVVSLPLSSFRGRAVAASPSARPQQSPEKRKRPLRL